MWYFHSTSTSCAICLPLYFDYAFSHLVDTGQQNLMNGITRAVNMNPKFITFHGLKCIKGDSCKTGTNINCSVMGPLVLSNELMGS